MDMSETAKMKILVTGGAGFIGCALVNSLLDSEKHQPLASVRRITPSLPPLIQSIDEVGPNTDWRNVLKNVDVVVHNAALVHVTSDGSNEALEAYRESNALGTLNLALQALSSGVKRFVYISSIKVNGECTHLNRPFEASDAPNPVGPYAVSKFEAENGLNDLSARAGMEVVIIRPPLVYGPGVKANFHTMMRWLMRGIPLPLAAVNNKRSLLALDNLISLIVTCIEHPAAANQTFLVSDGEDLSTPELLRRLGALLGKPARLFPVPQKLLDTSLRLLGKGDMAMSLCSSLQVDMSKTNRILNWMPPLTVDQGLLITAQDFLRSRESDN